MIETILLKAYEVVRGTALVVGAAVMLALLFRVASTAFAHKRDLVLSPCTGLR